MKKKTWNEINIPSPINEIHIESFKNSSQSEINYIDIENKEKQEILRGNISNNSVEDVLEIQEINALSIISNKNRYNKNICQHLQSLSILSNKNYNKQIAKNNYLRISSIPVSQQTVAKVDTIVNVDETKKDEVKQEVKEEVKQHEVAPSASSIKLEDTKLDDTGKKFFKAWNISIE